MLLCGRAESIYKDFVENDPYEDFSVGNIEAIKTTITKILQKLSDQSLQLILLKKCKG